MAYKIKPIIDTSAGGRTYNLDPGGVWSWLDKQDFSYERAYTSIGNTSRGKVLGGPTYQQYLSMDDPKKFTVLYEPPALTSAVLDGETNGLGARRVGQLNLDAIDPAGSLGQLTGTFIGRDIPLVGPGGEAANPEGFLASKDIDIFGRDDVGVPARLTDYAFALPIAILNRMRGVETERPESLPSGMSFRFQADPRYWQLIEGAQSDDELRLIARTVAAAYINPARNEYLVKKLYDQFKQDRDVIATAMSSGNARIDYVAKWALAGELSLRVTEQQVALHGQLGGAFTGDSLAAASVRGAGVAAAFVSTIPWVGTQIAAGVSPIDPALEAAWASLTPDERRTFFGQAGVAAGALDFAVQLPLLTGIGGALAVARGSTGIGHTIYRAYDTTLRASGLLMGTGLVVATANWAAEAMWPGYLDDLGKEIDYARPISKSSFAGLVNEIGFWSSGTFGVYPAVQVAKRGAGLTTRAAGHGLDRLGVPHPTLGTRELSFFRFGFGGSTIRREIEGTGLTGLDTSVKAAFLSHLLNWVERTRRAPYEAILRGEQSPWDDVNAMDPVARVAWAEDQLARIVLDGPERAMGFIRILGYARRAKPILPDDATRRMWDTADRVGRTTDEQLTHDISQMYGPEWIASPRMVGGYNAKAMEEYARRKVTELGGDGTKLGSHDEEGWTQIIRTLHQHEYHRNNGHLDAALGMGSSEEAGKIAVVSSDHVFTDNADTILRELETADPAAASQLIATTIRTKREARKWFTDEWTPQAGVAKTPENVPPSVFAEWLEDIRPALPTRRAVPDPASSTASMPLNALHTKLEEEGLWTLAFKPSDEAGNLVTYVRTRGGGVFRSPWVEYPMGPTDMIELGNRGLLGSKLDSLFRGIRTYRLTEFQRASLFRRLSGRIDVLPEQIEAFHEGILQLAHDRRIPPQTVGTIAKLPEVAFGIQTRKEIDELATRIFGPGDMVSPTGGRVHVDWANEIAKAYRQAFKLNLTAGVTSALKSMGPIGAVASVSADIIYVAWRFGFSPIFKGGEVAESALLNILRGVFRRDPLTEALYVRGGLGNDGSLISSEQNFDQLIQGLGRGGRAPLTPQQRLAASLSLHVRHLPESLPDAQVRAQVQAEADEFRRVHGAGFVPPFAEPGDVIPEGPAIYDPARPVGRAVPLDFSADHADFLPAGVVDDTLPPEDRGLWHATTSTDGVLRRGLRSRQQITAERGVVAPHEAVQGGHRVWTTYGDSIIALGPAYKGKATSASRRRLTTANKELKAAREEHDEVTGKGVLLGDGTYRDATSEELLAVSDRLYYADREREHAKQYLDQERQWWIPYRARGSVDVRRIPAKNVVSVENAVSGEVVWQLSLQGLGGGGIDPGHNVSTTISRHHAETIAERLKVGARAARGEYRYSSARIHRHFVETAPDVFDTGDEAADLLAFNDAIFAAFGYRLASKVPGAWTTHYDEIDNLLRDSTDDYKLVQALDNLIDERYRQRGGAGYPDEPWSGAVGLTASWEEMRLINPDQIGIVQVAARKGGLAREGPDANELQFKPEDVFVIDDRPALEPLADDIDGLLRQLKQTLRTEPGNEPIPFLQDDLNAIVGENGIQPGLEGRAQAILDEIERQLRTIGDDGPVYSWANMSHRQQEEAIRRMAEAGDLTLPEGMTPENTVVTYHGTPSTAFESFDPNLLGKRRNLYGPGIYITEDASVASSYISNQRLLRTAPEPAHLDQFDPTTPSIFGRPTMTAPVDEPGFLYTTVEDLHSLENYGLSGEGSHVFLAPRFDQLGQLGLSGTRIEEGVIVRLQNDIDLMEPVPGNPNISEVRTDLIPPSQLEYLGSDGAWHRIEKPTGALLRVTVRKDLNLLDLEQPLPKPVRDIVRRYVKANKARYTFGTNALTTPDLQRRPGHQVWDWLENGWGYDEAEVIRGQTEFVQLLQEAGYDGFAHLGGRVTGNKPHQVRIIWSPENASIIPVDRLDETWAQFQRRPGNTDSLDEIAGTPEALFDATMPAFAEEAIARGATGWVRRAWDTIVHPTGYKQDQALALQIKLMRDQFPSLLRASGNDGAVQVFQQLGIREDRWSDWLLEDRRLLDEWLNVKGDPERGPAALAKLLDHTGPENRADFDALYASEEWGTLTSLWAINLQTARDEAFGVHFFNVYRSPVERSLNHPVLGIYPASWTIKAAREWAKFLFDNRTFGDLRLGMAPAQAIAETARAQASAWAQTHDESLAHYYEKGPLGSTVFIFNLLMPGDWSSLPFPASRTIREILRGNTDVANIMAANWNFMGASRDARLIGESLGEMRDIIFGPEAEEEPEQRIRGWSARGFESPWSQPRR